MRFLVIIFLVFSCSSIKIGGENNVNQSYETGYGEQQKSSSTTSVQSIDGDKINLGSSSNVNDALRGQASGLFVRRPNTGMPDDFATFVIRNFSHPPLIIVDGMEATIEIMLHGDNIFSGLVEVSPEFSWKFLNRYNDKS